MPAEDPGLVEILHRLVETYRPERTYLFGSRARGRAGPESDYDLLVVVPDDVPPRPAAERPRVRGPLGASDVR